MAFSDLTALRFRDALGTRSDVAEKRMMGGLVFMVGGHMAGGVDRDKAGKDRFMFRVGTDAAPAALRRSGATQVMMGARPMKGFVFVAEDACDDAALADWLRLALDNIAALPPK